MMGRRGERGGRELSLRASGNDENWPRGAAVEGKVIHFLKLLMEKTFWKLYIRMRLSDLVLIY